MTLRAPANGIEIAYETFGSPGARPLLLITGLGCQMIQWDGRFCALLADRGYHVVRFDNRDSGESTHLNEAGTPALDGSGEIPYLLEDMADDAAGLLDALGWDTAHVVGLSMGGMIAQSLAIRHPDRVRSLTSIMSTPSPRAALLTDPDVLLPAFTPDRESAIRRALDNCAAVGSPGYPFDREWNAEIAGLGYDRSYDPAGTARQVAAIMASGDRAPRLAELAVPALVLHGEDDPLVPLPAGIATAGAIPGARLMTFPGMGHDLPAELWPSFADAIDELTGSADSGR
ncbi:alpha/beta hydrolase [Streptosporangium sp. NPDC048865]|uniref:alpha/beta fold hydrolase n=1 Tax=Streptosporangium sp. NPDC048865 TaxID=3155766 RepID=UPI00343F93C7